MEKFKTFLIIIKITTLCGALTDDTPMQDGQPIAVTPWGSYLGRKYKTIRQKRDAYAFTGIPYALPPIGDLRFRHPVRAAVNHGVFNATTYMPECLQWDHLRGRGVVGQEDCLYLNVYVNRVAPPPDYPNTQPTLVFLHAGTYMAGSGASDIFEPDYFLEHDLAVVTVNHRLGPLGFLSTESADAPGNYGLMDQIMALEWVRNNVRYFGGFNDTVTVMGSGAGGSSVHLLTMSPKTRGFDIYPDDQALMGKAISHSGTAYSPHAITRNAKSQANILAHKLNCYDNDMTKMVDCMRTKEAKQIVENIPFLFEFDEEPLPFTPVIDTWQGSDAIIPDEPYHLIKNRQFLQIPWISGINENDGAFRVQDLLKDPSLISQLNSNWDKYGPILLHLKHSCKDPVGVANQIKNFYLGKKKFGEDTAPKFVEMLTDRFFLHPTHQAMNDHCYYIKHTFCYRYLLHYSGLKSFLDILHLDNPEEDVRNKFGMSNPRFQHTRDAHGWGVSFLDELLYLFPSKKLGYEYKQDLHSDPVSSVAHQMQILYSNFIKGGDPTPSYGGGEFELSPWGTWWEPYAPRHNYYLFVEPDMETKDGIYRSEQMNFWNSLPLFENRDHHVIRDEL